MQNAAAFWSVGDLDSECNGVLWAGPIEEVSLHMEVWMYTICQACMQVLFLLQAWHRQEIAFLADSHGNVLSSLC